MNLRNVTRIATLGALWGVSEMTLGAAMHTFHTPFLAMWLTIIGMTIALTGAAITGRPGTMLGIGVVASLLKPFSLGGGSIVNVMIAIVLEALVAEGVLRAFRYRLSGWVFAAAMVAAILWGDILHPILVGSVLTHQSPQEAFGVVLGRFQKVFHLGPTATWILLSGILAVRLTCGVVAGRLSWSIARAVAKRMGRDITPA